MTPDLVTKIQSEDLTASLATEIERSSKSSGRMYIQAEVPGRWFGDSLALYIPEVHDLLTDAADWDAETWDMDPTGLERLAVTLEWLYGHLPGAFTFEASWGDPIEYEPRVSRSELLDIVRRGEIGTRTRYHVSAI